MGEEWKSGGGRGGRMLKVLGEVAAGVERKALKGATRGRMEFMVARTPDHHHTPHTTPTPPHNGIKPHHNTHTHPERRYFDHIQQPAAFSELEALLYSLHCQRQRPIAHTSEACLISHIRTAQRLE